MSDRRGVLRWQWRTACVSVVWISVIVAALWFWPARLGGSTTFVVVRGKSMQPTFDNGDLVIARHKTTYAVGDVVVFRVPDGAGKGALIVHRLIRAAADGSIVTQGDNRSTADGFDLHLADIVGSVRFPVPAGGRLLAVFSTWWFLAFVAGVFVAARLWPDGERCDGADAAPSPRAGLRC